jgi:hypothetical protein
MSHGNVHRQLVAHFAITNDSMDFDGNEVILDADGDTSITSDTDDQIDVRISGADDFQFVANAFKVLDGSTIRAADDAEITVGDGLDAQFFWSTADASNHAAVLAVGTLNAALHVTNVPDKDTDWNVSAATDAAIYIHSDTTPATDYLRIGSHSGTAADIDLVGGATLNFKIDGTAELTQTASVTNVVDGNRLFVGVAATPGTQTGANWIGLEDSTTDPTGTLTNSLALYTPDAGDSLDFLHADGTTDSLGT